MDFPPNLIDKPGYSLEFSDEFEQADLDTTKWLPFYLPHWSSCARSAPRYHIEDGCLNLRIDRDQAAWCPEFDGEVRCSSVQSGIFAGPLGSAIGQHRFNPACRVREAQANQRLYTPQYGFFETRAKAVDSAAMHVSIWMIGYEDEPQYSGEIAIFEIMGDSLIPSGCRIGHGIHPWGDPHLSDEFRAPQTTIDATEFHIYALEWTPTHLDFYVDNAKIDTIDQSPDYPMQFMLGLYQRPIPVVKTPTSPYFTIDYLRGYQPLEGY